MDILLDTHSFIWYFEGNERLSNNAINLIESIDNNVFISIASLWEISIKPKLGKLVLKIPYEELKPLIISKRIEILPISFEDTFINSNLDYHHRDPFDRIIISQSLNNHLTVVGRDKIFDKYNVNMIW